MILTTTQALLIALAVTAGAIVTRFLPFLLFPDSRPVPKIVTYLGRTLPAAMMGLLLVYCLRNVDFAAAPHGLPCALQYPPIFMKILFYFITNHIF